MSKPSQHTDIVNIDGKAYIQAGILSKYEELPTADMSVVVSGYTESDSSLSGILQTDINSRVLRIGDTMTGPLYLSGIPTSGTEAANKEYVDVQVAAAAVKIQENSIEVQHSAGIIDFGYGIDVTSGTGKASITINENELLNLVHKSGEESINGNKEFLDDITVRGNLNVSGVINKINTEELLVEDNKIILNSTWSGSATEDAAIVVERGDDPNAQLLWNESLNLWEIGTSGSMQEIMDLADITVISGDIIDYIDGKPQYIKPSTSGEGGTLTLRDPVSSGGMVTVIDYIRETSPVPTLLGTGNVVLNCDQQNTFRKQGGSCTVTINNLRENQQINLSLESTGSAYTITFSGGTFRWPDTIQPIPTVTSGRIDLYSFIKINGYIFGSALLGF